MIELTHRTSATTIAAHPFRLEVLFGEQATDEYDSGGMTLDEILEDGLGHVSTFLFFSQYGRKCFIDGLYAAHTYGADYTLLDLPESSG